MNKEFIEQQRALAQQRLEGIDTDGKVLEKTSIVFQYLGSLLAPEQFTDAQKEDLRKLSLELEYTEDTDFEKWYRAFVEKQKERGAV